jgi:glucose-6-phosphate dehydrogenase assembly protein OpcA
MEVNAATIEKELRDLWKQMAEVPQEKQGQPVMRACALNLTVFAPGERSEDAVTATMAEITAQHPSRIIVLLPNAQATEASLHAWVTALCHLSAGGRKQVCCEEIMLRGEGKGIEQLPSLVRSLQIPDLPAVLWWRGNLELNDWLFLDLLETADRVIVDSATLTNPQTGLVALAQLVQREIQWTAFSDLDWARLTPWRVAISGFFDMPDYRHYLNQIERIEIECERTYSDNIPGQAFLIAGWLASRLKWKLKSKPSRAGQDRFSMELTSGEQSISIRIHLRQTTKKIPGIYRICLYEEDHPTADFAVTRNEDGQHLKTIVELSGKQHAGRIIQFDNDNETKMIGKELEILGHDVVYEQALTFLASLI